MTAFEMVKLAEGVPEMSSGRPLPFLLTGSSLDLEPSPAPPPFPYMRFAQHNIKVIARVFRDIYAQERKKLEKNFKLEGKLFELRDWEQIALEFVKRDKNMALAMQVASAKADVYPWRDGLLSDHYAPTAAERNWCSVKPGEYQSILEDHLEYVAQGLSSSQPAEQILRDGEGCKVLLNRPFIWFAGAHFGLDKIINEDKYRSATIWSILCVQNCCPILWQRFQKELELLLPESLRSTIIPKERTFGWHLQQSSERQRSEPSTQPRTQTPSSELDH